MLFVQRNRDKLAKPALLRGVVKGLLPRPSAFRRRRRSMVSRVVEHILSGPLFTCFRALHRL
jgi:hypothetical protein